MLPRFLGDSHQHVDGSPQESGVTPNNFDNIVTYKVVNDFGDEKDYQIDLTKFTGLPIINLITDGSVQIDSKEDYVEGDVSLDGRRDFESKTICFDGSSKYFCLHT